MSAFYGKGTHDLLWEQMKSPESALGIQKDFSDFHRKLE